MFTSLNVVAVLNTRSSGERRSNGVLISTLKPLKNAARPANLCARMMVLASVIHGFSAGIKNDAVTDSGSAG
jgi:hypothetical protein